MAEMTRKASIIELPQWYAVVAAVIIFLAGLASGVVINGSIRRIF